MPPFAIMKKLILSIALLIASCSSKTAMPDIPSPVLDDFSTEVAATVTAAHEAALEKPNDAQLVGRYGMLLQAYQQLDAAGELYLRATTLAPKEHRWNYYRAFVLESSGNADAALEAYRNAALLKPNYSAGQLRLANLLLQQGREEEAVNTFKVILENDPAFLPAGVGLGQALLSMGNETGARNVFEQVLKFDATNATAHYSLAKITRSSGDDQAAAEHLRLFEQYSKVQPLSRDLLLSEIGVLNQSDRPSMQRARNSLSRGDLKGAIGHFEEAIRRNPENIGARVSLVGMYAAANDFERAEEQYNKAVELAPSNGKLHFSYAFSQQRRGEHATAVEIFAHALTINPDDANAHAYLGVSQLALNEPEAALASLQKAVALDPQQREANARLGHLYLENGRAEDAIPHLNSATRRDDRYSITYLIHLADAMQQQGDPRQAAVARERALVLSHKFGDERGESLTEANPQSNPETTQ